MFVEEEGDETAERVAVVDAYVIVPVAVVVVCDVCDVLWWLVGVFGGLW